MAYKRQFYPGASLPAKNRRRFMDPTQEMKKLREVAMEDVVKILGHRVPGSEYKSIHPPLEEGTEPDCPIRQMVKPLEGAKAGDRVRYVQFTDSVYFAPIAPYVRAWMYLSRWRGIDTGTLSGRQIIEMRERDLEKLAKDLIENETFDPAKTGIRGATVHGHACRLDENGLMFDAWQRYEWNADKGEVEYTKDQVGIPLDVRVSVGKPATDADLRSRTTIFRADGVDMNDDEEVTNVNLRIHKLRTLSGFQPWKVKE
ncbi:MAG: coenzyme-B sulfoethylthiotransferase subunit gamma [Methanomassiliicoccales archaeon]|jgi:methyl-coenzyme M reductase gamma subunit|nr:coenzyme-B sulfoethylthiotransferase subunit gamma [Methanomassiliicoccales archaeon]NYT14966.1 coenzyme-B sulfoethylthiotransferase subunit gamma [Methanomassiliicoccales archaeon]